MKKFADRNDVKWDIDITVGTLKRVRAALDVDLFKITDDKFALMQEILNDPVLLVDILFIVCEQQVEERGMTDVQFGESLDGDTLFSAMNSFIEGMTDFFPERRGREALKKLMSKGREVYDLVSEREIKRIENLDVAKAATDLEKTLSKSSTNSPGSLV